jgi:hypothetical protein
LERELERNDSRLRRVARTGVSRKLVLGDLRDPATGNITEAGRNLLTHHNVEAIIDAHDAAHTVFFDNPIVRDPLLTPVSIKIIAEFIREILTLPTPDAMVMIKQHASAHLDVLSKT